VSDRLLIDRQVPEVVTNEFLLKCIAEVLAVTGASLSSAVKFNELFVTLATFSTRRFVGNHSLSALEAVEVVVAVTVRATDIEFGRLRIGRVPIVVNSHFIHSAIA
jgi:hypothetical protein